MEPFFTIIIPAYNAGKTISLCLDSILNQGFKALEVIVVNDGSTDNTASVVNEFVSGDYSVSLINQENSGQGNARNNAIKYAKGEYVWFVDSDDTIVPGSLTKSAYRKTQKKSQCS